MTDSAASLGAIPTIGSSQLGTPPIQDPKNMDKPDVAMFDNAPSDVSPGSFFGKIFIGLIVGVCMAALLFGTLAAIGGLSQNGVGQANPMIKIMLAVVGFIVNFVGSFVLALMYNIFFSRKYYNFGKMFALIFASSLIFFIFFLIMYVIYDTIKDLYILLGFQIIFGLYITLNLIDFLSQPNYCASSMLGNTLGCILAVVAYILIRKLLGTGVDDKLILLGIIPLIFAYTLMIFGSELWNAIYYKFYQWGSNPFYLPSLNELREERRKEEAKKNNEEEEDVNVEVK